MQFVIKKRRLEVAAAFVSVDDDEATEAAPGAEVTVEQVAQAKALQQRGNKLAEAGSFGQVSYIIKCMTIFSILYLG